MLHSRHDTVSAKHPDGGPFTVLQQELQLLRQKLRTKEAECCNWRQELQGKERTLQALQATMASIQEDIRLLHSTTAAQDEMIANYKQQMHDALVAGDALSRWVGCKECALVACCSC